MLEAPLQLPQPPPGSPLTPYGFPVPHRADLSGPVFFFWHRQVQATPIAARTHKWRLPPLLDPVVCGCTFCQPVGANRTTTVLLSLNLLSHSLNSTHSSHSLTNCLLSDPACSIPLTPLQQSSRPLVPTPVQHTQQWRWARWPLRTPNSSNWTRKGQTSGRCCWMSRCVMRCECQRVRQGGYPAHVQC